MPHNSCNKYIFFVHIKKYIQPTQQQPSLFFRMNSFRFDFSPSESDTSIQQQPKRATKRRRQQFVSDPESLDDTVDVDELELQELPATKLPIMVRELKNGDSAIIRKGLWKITNQKELQRDVRIAYGRLENEITTAINKGLLLLTTMLNDNHLEWLEWNSVNNIITAVLPDRTVTGYELLTTKLWKRYRMNISRSAREVSLYRLYTAIQTLGNEIKDCRMNCHRLILKISDRFKGNGNITFSRQRARLEKSLRSKPMRLERNGNFFEMREL